MTLVSVDRALKELQNIKMMRMITILVLEKVSQTLNSIMCCVHWQIECAYFIGYCICATCLWTAIHPFCSFLKYIFSVCLNFELFVLEDINPTVQNLSKNWCTPTHAITPFRCANWTLSAGVTNIWPLKNTTAWCYSKPSGARYAQEASVVLHHLSVALALFSRCYLSTQK